MTTRTKFTLCAGLLAVAVAVAVVFRSPAKPEVEVKFVRYEDPAGVVLQISNASSSEVICDYMHEASSALPPYAGIEAKFLLPTSESSKVVFDVYSFTLIHRFERFLRGEGVPLSNWPRVIWVELPPRTNAPAQPVTP